MRKLLLILGVVIVIIILFITISKILFDKKVIKEVGMLTEEGSKAQSKTFSLNDLEGLPEPVQRYFKYALKDGQEHIKFVTNDRYMEVDGKYFKEQWGGYYRNYQEINGIKIPTEAEVEWNLYDRDLQYVKLKITDIQYNITEKY